MSPTAEARRRRRRPGAAARILLLVPGHVAAGRAIVDGLIDYAAAHGPWEFLDSHRVGNGWEVLQREPERVDGVVVGTGGYNQEQAAALARSGLPVVVNSSDPGWRRFGTVHSDEREVMRLAVEHFANMGLRRLAICAQEGRYYFPARRERFIHHAAQAGCEVVDTLVLSRHSNDVGSWLRRERQLARWVRRLPKPVGVLADNLDEARDVASVCLAGDVAVPERVSILAIGVDRQRSRLAWPSLSMIDQGLHAAGYRIGALLDRMMDGQAPDGPVIVSPRGIEVGDSTRAVIVEDDDLARALQLIRQRACDGVKIEQLMDELPISRRKLERNLKKILGRTVHQELRRVRLERARQLLTETDLDLPDIAARSGFASSSDLCKIFRRHVGCTPGEHRSGSRRGDGQRPTTAP